MSFKANTFDFDKEYEKVKKGIKKPNILLCGATGVGKSSLINKIFSGNIAKTGSGRPVTRGIKKYEKANSNVILYDSEGYEIGSEAQAHFKEEVLDFVDKKRKESNELHEHIHLVWYCISAANKRVTDLDLDIIKSLQKKRMKVCVILTQIDSVDEEELLQMKAICRADKQTLFTVSIDEEVPEKYLQWDELISWSVGNLDDSLRDGFVMSLDESLDVKQNHVRWKVIPGYVTASAGVAASPIPFSDSALLIPIQLTMSIHILQVWGIDKLQGGVKSVIESTVISQVGKTVAGSLEGGLLKLIPGLGSLAGMVINASVASGLTLAMGMSISELSYVYAKRVANGEKVDINDVFSKENIAKTVGRFLARGKDNGKK